MSEELLQRDLLKNPEKIGSWDYYNIGSTTLKALKEHAIIRNVDYGDEEKKKVDALIVQKKNVIAVIEYKKPSEFRTVKQKEVAIKQELSTARKLKASILIATDTKDTIWINVLTGNKIKDDKGNDINIAFNPKDSKIADLIDKIRSSINELNDAIKPKQLVNPTDLAKQIWQDIWSVSGATPENCLYTFIELFIFKYLSDLNVLQGIYSFNTLIDSFKSNTEEEVLENYASVIRPKIKVLFPESQLDKTTIINGTIFVSKDQKAVKGYSAVFKKVLLKFKDYGKLEHIDYDFKSQLFESFLKESISKKNWGQFFTPLKVVRAIVEMAKDNIKEGIKICDPACGVGKFLLEPIVTRLEHYYEINKKDIIPKITIHGFDKGFDKDEQKTIILAKANMLIYFSDLIKDNPGITEKFSKIFNESFTLKTNSILGTLSDPTENEYDLILTNPPYVTSGSSNLKEEIKKDGDLLNYYKINALGVEGLFMEWIVRALKPNGRAFVVVPDGIFNRQNDKYLRQFITDECYIDGIISLPLNTFFTTSKKTYILSLTKKSSKKDIQTDPVFTYLVSEIGESRDVYRFDIEQDDLHEATTLFSFFKGNKNGFGKINSDNRCKIVPFRFFSDNTNNNWIIDKLWTNDERVQLGIIDKKEKMDLLDFSLLIEDVANTIKGFQEEVKELAVKKKSEIAYKQYTLAELFNIHKGNSKYTKKYGNTRKGKYPVFSASNNAPLTHTDTFDYNGEFLTWATNGFAGYIKILSGKFSINADRGLLKPKHDNINLIYIKYILEPILRNLAKGRKGEKGEDEFTKVYPSMIKDILLPMPVNNSGEFDLKTQETIVEKIVFIDEIKNKVNDYQKNINDLFVAISDGFTFSEVTIIDILSIEKGKALYTNKFISKNKGEYPVYSSQTINNGIIGHINTFDYDNRCITWTTDGIYAGTVFLRNGKFSMTTHCGALMLKNTTDNISLEYIYTFLKSNLREHAFGEQNKRVTKDIIKNIKIPIPVDSEGIFDIVAQKQISDKYQKITKIKECIIHELDKISDITLNFA